MTVVKYKKVKFNKLLDPSGKELISYPNQPQSLIDFCYFQKFCENLLITWSPDIVWDHRVRQRLSYQLLEGRH